jgi:hypothetical protein
MYQETEELETNSKINNIRDLYRGINDFKKGYHPRTFIVKDEKGDLFADSHSIMTRWRNYFSQLLNVHGAKDIRQAEIHTAEPLVPEPSALEFELAIEKYVSLYLFRYSFTYHSCQLAVQFYLCLPHFMLRLLCFQLSLMSSVPLIVHQRFISADCLLRTYEYCDLTVQVLLARQKV